MTQITNDSQAPRSQEREKDNKTLTPEQMQQRRKRIAIPLFVAVFLAVMY